MSFITVGAETRTCDEKCYRKNEVKLMATDIMQYTRYMYRTIFFLFGL